MFASVWQAATRLVISNRETAAFTLAIHPLRASEEQRGGINSAIIDGTEGPGPGGPRPE